MKNLSALIFLAVFAAFLLLPVGFVAASSLLFAAGICAIVVADYARRPRVLRVAPVVAMAPVRKERFGLAA